MSFPSESDIMSKELQNSDLIYVNLMTDFFKNYRQISSENFRQISSFIA